MVEFVVTQWYQHFQGQTFLIWLSYHYIPIWLMAAILNLDKEITRNQKKHSTKKMDPW